MQHGSLGGRLPPQIGGTSSGGRPPPQPPGNGIGVDVSMDAASVLVLDLTCACGVRWGEAIASETRAVKVNSNRVRRIIGDLLLILITYRAARIMYLALRRVSAIVLQLSRAS